MIPVAGFRTVGEIRNASDSELLTHPRISHISVAYLRRMLGGGRRPGSDGAP